MPYHALFKKTNHELVIRILLKLQGSTILHEFLEFWGVPLAKLLKRCLNLLLFNIVILFSLAFSW
jgi:hypothetical protein